MIPLHYKKRELKDLTKSDHVYISPSIDSCNTSELVPLYAFGREYNSKVSEQIIHQVANLNVYNWHIKTTKNDKNKKFLQ